MRSKEPLSSRPRFRAISRYLRACLRNGPRGNVNLKHKGQVQGGLPRPEVLGTVSPQFFDTESIQVHGIGIFWIDVQPQISQEHRRFPEFLMNFLFAFGIRRVWDSWPSTPTWAPERSIKVPEGLGTDKTLSRTPHPNLKFGMLPLLLTVLYLGIVIGGGTILPIIEGC